MIENKEKPTQELSSAKEFLNAKFAESKKINSPLPAFTANNIKSAHIEIGTDASTKATETQAQFKSPGRDGR